MTKLHSNQSVIRFNTSTAGGYTRYYELENNSLIQSCPECGQGIHTRCQAKACMKQNKEIGFTHKFNKYHFSRFERYLRWLLF